MKGIMGGESEDETMAESKPKPPEPRKCAHASCACNAQAGSKYCSDYCKTAPETELHCNCMHKECHL